MPPMKIQPIDSQTYRESSIRTDTAKPVLKSRLKRLFDRQFPTVLRISSVEKPTAAGEAQYGKDGVVTVELFEPSSVCLAKMVQNFIEETNEKQPAQKCGRNRCNCFNVNSNDSSDDEFDNSSGFGDSIPTAWYGDFSDTIKVKFSLKFSIYHLSFLFFLIFSPIFLLRNVLKPNSHFVIFRV